MKELNFKSLSVRIGALCLACVMMLGVCGCTKRAVTVTESGTEDTWITSEITISGDGTGNQLVSKDETTSSKTESNSGDTNKEPVLMSKEWSVQEKKFTALEGTTMKMWYGGELSDFDTQRLEAFKTRYGIEVKLERMGWTESLQNLPTAVAAGNAPDQIGPPASDTLRYVSGNLLQPMDDYIDLSDPIWNADEIKKAKISNKIYIVPNDVKSQVAWVYYNKTLFKELGLTEPYTYYKNGKWTWDVFLDLAKKATIKGSDGVTVKTYGVSFGYYQRMVAAQGVAMWDGKSATCNITNPTVIKGLNTFAKFYQAGAANLDVVGDHIFGNRGVAMMATHMQIMHGPDYYHTMKDEIGLVPLPPSIVDGKYYKVAFGGGSGICRSAKNPLGAMAWIYFCKRYENELEAKKDPTYMTEHRKYVSEEHEKIMDEYLAKATIIYDEWAGIYGLGGFFEDMCNNGKTAEETTAKYLSLANKGIKNILP